MYLATGGDADIFNDDGYFDDEDFQSLYGSGGAPERYTSISVDSVNREVLSVVIGDITMTSGGQVDVATGG